MISNNISNSNVFTRSITPRCNIESNLDVDEK